MSNFANVWAVIPARYSSTRLPGKPLLTLAGKPIVAHVVTRAIEAGIDPARVVVATDDERIFEKVAESGFLAVMTSSKHESGSDRVLEAARDLSVGDDDLLVNLQGDEPFVPPSLVSNLIDYASSSSFGIATACVPIATKDTFLNENVVKVVLGENGRAIYFSRSGIPYACGDGEGLENAFRHIGIYCYKMPVLEKFCAMPSPVLERTEKLEQLRALYYGIEIGCIKYLEETSHGIDTADEYQYLLSIHGA